MVSFNSLSFAQDIPSKIDTDYKFEGKDCKELIQIQVKEGASNISIKVAGTIYGGDFTAKIIDPNGEGDGGLSLCSKKGHKAKGHLEDHRDDPIPGIWKIEIKNVGGTGTVNVKVKQK